MAEILFYPNRMGHFHVVYSELRELRLLGSRKWGSESEIGIFLTLCFNNIDGSFFRMLFSAIFIITERMGCFFSTENG